MSYIEKKYKNNIFEIFSELSEFEKDILNLLSHKSIAYGDKIAKLCALCNKKINLILSKYYPEIKDLDDKLNIKVYLKFYYDLIDKLTDLVRNIEQFQKLDENYYNTIIDFIINKEILINGKYRDICTKELTSFYDKETRTQIEKILIAKIENKNREFFSMGPLEEEIKKIARSYGAIDVSIKRASEEERKLMQDAYSLISYNITSEDNSECRHEIEERLKDFLESKAYSVILKPKMIITNAKLLPD
ncbi:MAG: hypothetical protein EU542_07650 [Promethearchaeota archaeon]|nr:MAG: hypothetical protein EU542_07650 [Candidatus Lokiarchaeota archaeon]